jgi:tripartite-type tricarboxylate transporter receptor subunit TctC
MPAMIADRLSVLVIFFAAMVTSIALVPGQPAVAQVDYPSRPVTIIVPLPPGGAADILARGVSEKLQTYTGQAFLVENVTGGGTIVAAERVARAPADGYTLLVATSTTLSSNPQFYHHLPYKIGDFEPISLLSANEFVLHIRQTLPASDFNGLISYARKTPGGLTYSTMGRGSNSEVLGELMKAMFKIQMHDIPYRGAPAALLDVMKGEIDMHFDNITSTIPHIGDRRTKMIATTGEHRSPLLPEVPTLAELGYPTMTTGNIFAMLAPHGTPRQVVDRLNGLVRRALAEDDLIQRWTAQGAPPRATTPEGLAQVMVRDNAFFEKNVHDLKLPPID